MYVEMVVIPGHYLHVNISDFFLIIISLILALFASSPHLNISSGRRVELACDIL